MSKTLSQAIAFGQVASEYQHLRATHPGMRALTVFRYIREDFGHGMTLEQFQCETERGHSFPRVEEWERCLCSYCGADGDA